MKKAMRIGIPVATLALVILGGIAVWLLHAAPHALLNPGWRLYENKTYGISFEYPPSLAVTEDSSHGYFSVSAADPKTHAGYLSVQVPDNRAQAERDLAGYLTGPYPKTVPARGITSARTVVQRTLANGLTGIEFYGYGGEGHSYDDTFVYAGMNHLWMVNLDPVLEGRISTYTEIGMTTPDKDTYERILASLRITDAPNTTATASQDAAILACYPKSPTGAADKPIPNDSVQRVKETSRMFINMPKDSYPKDIFHSWTTVAGNATAGYISNGGLPGEGLDAIPGCWSTYMEFDGSGEVDLRVKSVVEGVPDYFVRFIVSP